MSHGNIRRYKSVSVLKYIHAHRTLICETRQYQCNELLISIQHFWNDTYNFLLPKLYTVQTRMSAQML